MRNKLYSLGLALLASTGVALHATQISVTDGTISDWNNLPADYVFETVCPTDATFTGLNSVKVYSDGTYINLLVNCNPDALDGSSYGIELEVFVDVDNSDDTGGFGDAFTDANTDILIEGTLMEEGIAVPYHPAVYKWWGEVGGIGWEWTDPSITPSEENGWGALVWLETVPYVAESQFIAPNIFEIQIDRRRIPVTFNESEFGIGFELLTNWAVAGLLPCFSPTEDNPSGYTHKMKVIYDGVTYIPLDTLEYAYNDTALTAEVIGMNYNISGSLDIPATVTHDSVTYTVTSIANRVFYEKIGLTSVTLPEGLTTIGDEAFAFCSNLTSVSLPSTLQSIGTYAFCWSALSSINLPEGLTTIGWGAFGGCGNLTSVVIPSSLTNMDSETFYACPNLSSISVAPGNPVFDSRNNCNAIILTAANMLMEGCQNTVIPDGITAIAGGAFDGCSGLTTIRIPATVASIGGGAFIYCTSLTSINIPSGVTRIAEYTFKGCSNLTSIVLPASITSIGEEAFRDCYNLASVNLPAGVTRIEQNTFFNCTNLTSIDLSHITSFGPSAFANSGLTSVTLGNGVTSLGEGEDWPATFRGCPNLSSVTIQEGVTYIGSSVFACCPSLTSIVIPNSVSIVDQWAFAQDSNIVSITLGSGITALGFDVFERCYNLRSLTIYAVQPPSTVDEYSSWPFLPDSVIIYVPEESVSAYQSAPKWGQYRIRPISESQFMWTLQDGTLTTFGCQTMPNWEELMVPWYADRSTITKAVIEAGFTNLGNYALHGCYRLDTLVLPTSMQTLGYMSLAECLNLREVVLPASLQEIDDRAFENCRHLQTVTFSGNNLNRIGNWAFFQCLQLQNITIPEGVTEIGDAAFYECAYLNEVSLPASIQQIGDHAFASCSRMTKMNVDAVVPPTIDSRTFDEVSRTMPVYVPDASVNTYKADALWGQLNIVGASHEGTSLNNANSTTTTISKVIENGKMYILLPDGTRFDATGKRVE